MAIKVLNTKTNEVENFGDLEKLLNTTDYRFIVGSSIYDRNGIELFDGDIINYPYYSDTSKNVRTSYMQVFYADGCFFYDSGLHQDKNPEHRIPLYQLIPDAFKVVGRLPAASHLLFVDEPYTGDIVVDVL